MPNNTSTFSDRRLDGLKVLITGGSGGIGYATALAAASAGAIVTIHGRSPGRLAERSAELASSGAFVSTICADLSAGMPTGELLAAARTSDILVLAYGPFIQKPLAMTDASDWKSMALTCLALPGILASAAATSMASRGFGRILLFGGTRTDTIRGFKTNAAYASAKTGLGVLAKSISGEFGMHGVSCAVICPGFVDTEYTSPTSKKELGKASPRGALIPVTDVAGLALYLIAGGMDLVNGSIIVADTGLQAT
jgi:NAD(P)-dependent dehydrogenase (short-subunit alcohol dehydrogenase family)